MIGITVEGNGHRLDHAVKRFWLYSLVWYIVLEPGLHEVGKDGLKLEEDCLLVYGVQVHRQELLSDHRHYTGGGKTSF